MRIKHKATVVALTDATGKDKLFAPDDTLAETILDGFSEVSSGTAVLAANAVLVLPLGGITDVRGVWVKGTGDFALSLSGGTAINVVRGHTAAGGTRATSAKALIEAQMTSVQVTCGGASGITLTWCLWGDPLA